MGRGPICGESNSPPPDAGTSCRQRSLPPVPNGSPANSSSAHYTLYNTAHAPSHAGRLIDAIPAEDDELHFHPSVNAEKEELLGILAELRAENPDYYFGEIYTRVLRPGPMQANYAAAANFTDYTDVDNRTRYALQLILVRYVITYGRNFASLFRGEFSYALHERAFRWAGNRGTIGWAPWALLETVDVTVANRVGAPIGDFAIITAIEELNPPSGEFSEAGLLIRQYIDYVSVLWKPIFKNW